MSNFNITTTTSELLNNHLPILMATQTESGYQGSMSAIVVGAAGTGKTYIMTHQVPELWAETNGVGIDKVATLVYRCADRDAAEFAGLMMPSKNADGELQTVASIPDLLRQIRDLRDQGYSHIVLVLDEIMQANQDVQKTLSDLLDRNTNTLGGHDLGDGIFVVGTGNRQQDKSGARPALGHLRNRVAIFELEGYNDTTVGVWIRGYAEPAGLLPVVIDVARDHACDGFFADSVPIDGAYNSFRGLTNVSRLISTYMQRTGRTKLDRSMEGLVASVIGESAAQVISDHLDCEGEVPTADDILSNPETAMVPNQTGYQNIAGTLALQIAVDEQSADAAIQYIMRLRPDLQVQLGVRLLNKSQRLGCIMISDIANQFIMSHNDLIQLAEQIEG
jgi:type II secretory pathway predicted ATPase ExeA